MRPLCAAALAFALAACVPYPGEAPAVDNQPALSATPFPALDPGAASLDSLHFSVHAYGADTARQI